MSVAPAIAFGASDVWDRSSGRMILCTMLVYNRHDCVVCIEVGGERGIRGRCVRAMEEGKGVRYVGAGGRRGITQENVGKETHCVCHRCVLVVGIS